MIADMAEYLEPVTRARVSPICLPRQCYQEDIEHEAFSTDDSDWLWLALDHSSRSFGYVQLRLRPPQ